MSMRPAVPLSVQLLLTFVGLLLGMTWVLMSSANTSLLANLETEAQRTINVATKAREQTLTQLFQLRQQRAEGTAGQPRIALRRTDRRGDAWAGSTTACGRWSTISARASARWA